METFKDFDAAYAEQRQDPIRFRAGGEDFQVGNVGAGQLLRLARLADSEGPEATAEFDNLCRSLIPEADRERWDKVIDRISIETLTNIVEFIVEASTGRPLDQPSASRAQRRVSGGRSNTSSRRSAKKTA